MMEFQVYLIHGKIKFFLSWEVCPEPLRSHCERHPLALAVVTACGSLLSGAFKVQALALSFVKGKGWTLLPCL